MTIAVSTAISDAVLCLCALMALRAAWDYPLARAGFGLVGLAAAFGTLRFAGLDVFEPVHIFVSRMAAVIGLPLVALAYAEMAWDVFDDHIDTLGVLVGIVGAIGFTLEPLRIGMGGAAMVAIMATVEPVGAVGALLTIGAGLGVGTEGMIGPVPTIDLYHYILALGMLGLGAGLDRLGRP